MEQHDVDDDLTEAAETIADMWTNLSVAAANKLRVMQDPGPLSFRQRLLNRSEPADTLREQAMRRAQCYRPLADILVQLDSG